MFITNALMESKMSSRKTLLSMAAMCAMACAGIVACATHSPYNPAHLSEAQYTKVAGICQNVMGLSPSEPQTGGYWRGNDQLGYFTSHYRGCIVGLSDSLQLVDGSLVMQHAENDCRAKGFRTGSPDLALCVLQTAQSQSEPTPVEGSAAAATAVSVKLPTAGSYYRASPQEAVRREQMACAALGLDPAKEAFDRCVKKLDDTFYDIDNPISY
ncbi:MAG: hypothetical protein QOI59_4157 [Gammaproteobacteria bacterium]|jgi:hypothetical protein|nr:hypothetical protein [Gammaproteobacteria bacterium]